MSTDYITPKVDIDGRDYSKVMCRENPSLIHATCCVEKYKSCHTDFMEKVK